jgi:hypothetical protein
VIAEVARERQKQQEARNFEDGTDPALMVEAEEVGEAVAELIETGAVTWHDLITAPFANMSAETDAGRLRAHLVEVAALAVEWIEAIDRRAVEQ